LTAFSSAVSGRRFAAVGLIALSMIGVNWIFVLRTLPSFERYKPVPAFTETIVRRAGRGAVVLHYKVALPSMAFYLRGPYEGFLDPQAFAERFSSTEAYGVLTAEDYEALKPSIKSPSCVIDQKPSFDVKLRSVLAREPPPDLVLITNKCP
jgi:hypothetical protein